MARRILEMVTGLINSLLKQRGRSSRTPRARRPKPGSKPAGTAAPTTNPVTHATPSRDAGLDGTVVEYSPTIDGDPDPGEVVWTWVPWEEDPMQGKDRPVVIFGRRRDLLVGVPLTSKQHDQEAQVFVGTGAWDRERRPSYAKLERILEIDPSQVRREGAVLDKARFNDLVAALRREHRRP